MRRQITELSDLKGAKKMNAILISNTTKIFALLSKNFCNLGLLQLFAPAAVAVAFLSSL